MAPAISTIIIEIVDTMDITHIFLDFKMFTVPYIILLIITLEITGVNKKKTFDITCHMMLIK